MKKSIILPAIAVMMIMLCLPVSACVGSRPYGMGGAFTATANSPEAVYWNPAGLRSLEGRYVTATFSHGVNYPLFVAYTKDNIGGWYVYRQRWNGTQYEPFAHWFAVSAGFGENPAIGLGIRGRFDHWDGDLRVTHDIGILWDRGDHAVGILIQSLGFGWGHIRPAASARFGNLTIGVDLYPGSPYGEYGQFGAEYDFGKWQLRVGRYHGMHNLGLGLNLGFMGLDNVQLDISALPDKTPIPGFSIGITTHWD